MKWTKRILPSAAGLLLAATAHSQTAPLSGTLLREYYLGQTRTAIEAGVTQVPQVSTVNSFEAPQNTGVNNYAQRVSGYFIAPATGAYVFFVCSDDDSDLFVSTDATAANKQLVCQEMSWSNPRKWVTDDGSAANIPQKRSDQWSPDGTTTPWANGINLTAGHTYYIEADMHQGTGGDNLAATFKLTTEADPNDGDPSRFAGTNVFINVTLPKHINVVADIGNETVYEHTEASFHFATTNDSSPNVTGPYQWYRNGVIISNATGNYYTFLATAADNGAQYTCVQTFPAPLTNVVTSSVATLTVLSPGVKYTNGLKEEFFFSDRPSVENGNVGPATSITVIPTAENPINDGINSYVRRMSGYFIAPATTNYVFFVCSDDDSDLFISTDSTAANKQLVAQETGWSNSRQWTSSGGGSSISQKRSDQFVPPGNTNGFTPFTNGIPLVAGNWYYMEYVAHQGGGGDNGAVTFIFSGAPDPVDGDEPQLAATNNNIALITSPTTHLTFTTSPANTTVFDGQTAKFSAAVSTDSEFTPFFQWYKNGAVISNATSLSFNYTASIADNGSKFYVVGTTAEGGIVSTSAVATLTVQQAVLENGFLKVEFWSNQSGLAPLVNGTEPDPDYVTTANSAEGPINDGINNYNRRVSGFFIPQTSGSYTFFVCSDDNSQLFLSTDASASNKQLIAQETAWSNSRQWTSSGGSSSLTQKRSDQWSPDGGVTVPYANGITLTAGTKYYFEADQNQGGGGDNIAVTYKLTSEADPNDGDAPRMSAGNTNIAFNAPSSTVTLTQSPQSVTALSGRVTTFTAAATTTSTISIDGNLNQFVLFQWYRNNNPIPGAITPTYTTPILFTTNSGDVYTVQARSMGDATWQTSTPATLTVIPYPPIPSVSAMNRQDGVVEVGITFDESVNLSTLVAGNFTLSSGTVTGIKVATNSYSTYEAAVLQTTGLAVGGNYTLTIKNVAGLDGQAIGSTNVNFTVGKLTWAETGQPISPGQVIPVGANGFDVLNGGRQEWGTYDEVTMAYVQKTNDFDVAVEVVYAEPASKWARVGLQARNDLNVGEDPNDRSSATSVASAYAQTHVNPTLDLADTGLWPTNDTTQPQNAGSNNGHEQNERLTAGGATQGWGATGDAPTYPHAWVRLARKGTQLHGYRSVDGSNWIDQGTTTLTDQTNVMFVGISLGVEVGNIWNSADFDVWGAPYNPTYDRLFVAQFRNFGDVGGGGGTPTPSPLTFSYNSGAGTVTINWTVAGTLQQSAALGAGASWSAVSGAPNSASGGSVTVPTSGAGTFYRLLEQ